MLIIGIFHYLMSKHILIFQSTEAVTLNTSTHIKGESSGATGFLKYNVSAGTCHFTAYNVNGNFHRGERLLFNGMLDDSRFVTSDTNYSLSDVKSIHGIVGSANTFYW